MIIARKPTQATKLLAVLAFTIPLLRNLHAQDVLSANPEIWGLNARHADAACGADQESQLLSDSAVVAQAQLRGILQSARQAEKQGKNEYARRLYEQAIQLAPTDRITLLSYARLLHRLGDLDGSISLYYRSLEHHRNDAVAMNDLALCYARKGEFRHALAMMNGAVSVNPDSKRYRNNLAKLFLELERPNDAFAQFVAAGGPAIGHFNMGQMLNQRGRVEEAIQYLEIAIEMDPSLRPAIDLLRELRSTRAMVSTKVARLPRIDTSNSATDELSENDSSLAGSTQSDNTATTAQPSNLPEMEFIESKSTVVGSMPESRREPKLDRPWSPGSIKLQSGTVGESVWEQQTDWAATVESLDRHDQMIAPIPFESPFNMRRYTKPETTTDAIDSFLEGLEAPNP